jgi:hypothetical protein
MEKENGIGSDLTTGLVRTPSVFVCTLLVDGKGNV